VVRDERDAPKPEPGKACDCGPGGTADDVPQQELAVGQVGHSHDRWNVCAHDGHEAGEHERLGAVFGEEGVRLVEVFRLEDAGIRFEEPAAESLADEVADLVPGDRGERGGDDEHRNRQRDGGAQQRRGEEKAVARQEREQQARLDEDEADDDGEHPRP